MIENKDVLLEEKETTIKTQTEHKQTVTEKIENNNTARPLWYNLNLSQTKTEVSPEIEPEQEVQKEEICENVDEISTSENTDTFSKASVSLEQKHKKIKFRKKLSIITCSIIVALCCGLITYNAVEISNTNYQVTQMIMKINQLDNANKVNDPNSLLSNTLPIETKPLEEPTKTQKQTNWFDGICNFFSNLFGG